MFYSFQSLLSTIAQGGQHTTMHIPMDQFKFIVRVVGAVPPFLHRFRQLSQVLQPSHRPIDCEQPSWPFPSVCVNPDCAWRTTRVTGLPV